ncbi:hypothetical protein Tsubulata_039786 [Turnera subulata]|uniref:Uncharacterized protein n=1 Tax=Turnera subulata TaxID=218843 RepID=A0A9Q0FS62_9ROSI|nr:hypothetical protein Tsubulata_039786 [Turnera subulata]
MGWLNKVVKPGKRNGLSVRLGKPNNGKRKLKRDVKACEYEDVRVMWDMLENNKGSGDKKKRTFKNCFGWVRSCSCFGLKF